jgi:hypothetical protein
MTGLDPAMSCFAALSTGAWRTTTRGAIALPGAARMMFPLLAQSRHAQCADECPLLAAKRTLTNRCFTNLDL